MLRKEHSQWRNKIAIDSMMIEISLLFIYFEGSSVFQFFADYFTSIVFITLSMAVSKIMVIAVQIFK